MWRADTAANVAEPKAVQRFGSPSMWRADAAANVAERERLQMMFEESIMEVCRMEMILSLLKSYLILMLLLLILSYLSPKDSYRKYFQFFIGAWMCVLLLRPVFGLFDQTEEAGERVKHTLSEELSEGRKWTGEGVEWYELFEMDTEEEE